MRKLNLLIAVVTMLMIALTGCENNSMEEIDRESYETIDVEIIELDYEEDEEVVEEEVEEVVEEEVEEEVYLCIFYRSLIAFYDFLKKPQSMYFDGWTGTQNVSWNLDTLRYARLVDFRGDGIPQLLILPPQTEPPIPFSPVAIIGYSGEIDVLYRGIMASEGGGSVRYDLAITNDGRELLVEVDEHGAGMGFHTAIRTYLVLEENEIDSALTNMKKSQYDLVDGNFINPTRVFYVNSNAATEADFNNAPSQYLGIMETISLWYLVNDDSWDIQSILRYIEERLLVVGFDLSNRETG